MGNLHRNESVFAKPVGAGILLREAREANGMSLRDVASVTRVSPEFLLGLEVDEIDADIAPIYAIGYARAYARMVGVSEDIAVADVRRIMARRAPRRASAGHLLTAHVQEAGAADWWDTLCIAAIAVIALLIAQQLVPL